ncbi:MAG TPA: phosphate signaling complex protein PhoU [Candidatus Hydrothermia bacterium]|nr:phosphate signaling complex protein PhoU [Candidatus Hydrothermae bacterium]MDD3648775.1 phosphate signaling complex protein PhoU [Candidatus Hydrothermia bacterium]MDD5572894.1 phosphate signaling complex protein PhoU [Candidatus Hydrothermia bacterium]HOK23280.1 phosphate signaling complex protein PhoU [Candidatus Hydrothermia bacterium]HOL24089.1 phosphate signaling complex protein PhoU [Candidatus Hydrothermia bacterium]
MMESKLQNLKEAIHAYHLHVSNMLQKSILGIVNKDRKLLEEVIAKDEPFANEKELQVDELCIDFIALYAPRGRTLRTVIMIMKMNNDFERICDQCVNISECGLRLTEIPGSALPASLIEMVEYTTIMLKDAFNSFHHDDSALAKDILKRDEIVDNLHHNNVRMLAEECTERDLSTEAAIDLLIISSNLERIADLSTNIAEDVIYIVEGKTYKHGHYKNDLGSLNLD